VRAEVAHTLARARAVKDVAYITGVGLESNMRPYHVPGLRIGLGAGDLGVLRWWPMVCPVWARRYSDGQGVSSHERLQPLVQCVTLLCEDVFVRSTMLCVKRGMGSARRGGVMSIARCLSTGSGTPSDDAFKDAMRMYGELAGRLGATNAELADKIAGVSKELSKEVAGVSKELARTHVFTIRVLMGVSCCLCVRIDIILNVLRLVLSSLLFCCLDLCCAVLLDPVYCAVRTGTRGPL
jgi:hypothetical protein